MVEKDKMMTMKTINRSTQSGHQAGLIKMTVDLFYRELELHFQLPRRIAGTNITAPPAQFKLKAPFDTLGHFFEHATSEEERDLVIPFSVPAEFFKRTDAISATHDNGSGSWNDNLTWFRQTDIVHNAQAVSNQPLRLRKEQVDIDIGK